MRKPEIFLAAAGLAIGAVAALLSTGRTLGPRYPDDERNRPDASLSPSDVVRRQLDALQAASDQPEAIEVCYRYASPANREYIGSVSDFESLLRSRQYSPLIGHRDRVVGRPVYSDDSVTLLVTIIDPGGEPFAYRFVLDRQNRAPFEGCWMTSAVWVVPKFFREDPGSFDRPRSDANQEKALSGGPQP